MAGEVLAMGPEVEHWLPLDFLDDDFFFGRQEKKKSGSGYPAPLEFPTEFPYDYSSGFSSSSSSPNPSSPVDSATESEGQSDDDLDEYLAGLTTAMAHSFLQEADSPGAAVSVATTKKKLSCSPLALTCAWSSPVASKPLFEVSTPPPPPKLTTKDENPWDSLHAAADQVVRTKQLSQQRQNMGSPFGVVGGRSSPGAQPQACQEHGSFTNSDGGAGTGSYYYYYHHLKPPPTQRQLQLAQLQHLKQQRQQLVNQQLAAVAAWRRRNGRALGGPSPAWPALQPSLGVGKAPRGHPSPPPLLPPPGSGMRALFLPSGLGQKQSTGTGVFLPRRAGSPGQIRRKPACSTVLVPARVVHALNNLNLEPAAAETGSAGHCFGAVAPPASRPAEVYGSAAAGACFTVGRNDDDARVAAVASYSSSMEAGGGDRSNSIKKTKSCGGEQQQLRHGRLPQEGQQKLLPQSNLPQQQQQKQQSLAVPVLSPETRLPSEWIY